MPLHIRHSFSIPILLAASAASAQTYPDRPVRIVVPFAAGGGVDTLTRIVATELGVRLKQPIVVENKPGASANLGADYVAKSPPDGYTLLMTSSVSAVNRAISKDLPYDALTDFAQIAGIAQAPLVMAASSSLGAKTVKELGAYAKANPTSVSYASTGLGSGQHINGAIVSKYANIPAVHVPYKGGSAALADLLSGRVTFMITIPSEVLPHIASGKLTALAVTGPTRVEGLPGVPTFTEAGMANPGVMAWWGLVAPAKTPSAVIQRLESEVLSTMKQPQVIAAMKKAGFEPSPMSSAEFTKFYRSEIDRYAGLAKEFHLEAK